MGNDAGQITGRTNVSARLLSRPLWVSVAVHLGIGAWLYGTRTEDLSPANPERPRAKQELITIDLVEPAATRRPSRRPSSAIELRLSETALDTEARPRARNHRTAPAPPRLGRRELANPRSD